MQRILIINPFGIGDVLFTTPLIHALKENFPQSFIAYVCNYRVEPILKENSYIDEIIPFSRGDIKKVFRKSKIEAIKQIFSLIKKVKKNKFDLFIDFSLDYRYCLGAKLLGIPKRIGFNYKNRGRFLTDKIDIEGYTDKHIVEYYLDLLKFLGINPVREPKSSFKFTEPSLSSPVLQREFSNEVKPTANRLELFLSKQDEEWADRHLRGVGIGKDDFVVGIAPFGGETFGKQAEIKHWPVENYAQLADLLISKLNAKVVILCGDKEKTKLAHLFSLMHNKAIDTTQNSIRELASIINNCKLIISNDTGPLRFANALDIPSISLFGPVSEKVYGPYPPSEKYIVIKKDLPCRPCYKKFKIAKCSHNQRCLKAITVQEIMQEVEKLLISEPH